MNKQGNRILVGFFTAGAIAILLGFSVFTGGFSNLRNQNERFVLVFNENVYGLNEGGKVTLNGVRIGRVERFFIGDELEKGPVPVLIEINRKLVERHMTIEGNEVFDSGGRFKKKVLNRLMGQLVQESFVTGILYINLTTESIEMEKPELKQIHGYPEIPTKDSIFAELSDSINLEKFSQQISSLLLVATERLDELDTSNLSAELVSTSFALRNFLDEFSDSYLPLGKSMTKTSEQTRQTLVKIGKISDQLDLILTPNSDFRFELGDTLREVSQMAKSLKALAELLERNPQAFIRGKPSSGE